MFFHCCFVHCTCHGRTDKPLGLTVSSIRVPQYFTKTSSFLQSLKFIYINTIYMNFLSARMCFQFFPVVQNLGYLLMFLSLFFTDVVWQLNPSFFGLSETVA